MAILHKYRSPKPNGPKAQQKRRIAKGIIGATATAALAAAFSFGNPNPPTPTPSVRPATRVAVVERSTIRPKTTPTPTPVPKYTAAELELQLKPRFRVVGGARDPKLPEVTSSTIAWQLNRINPAVADHATTITLTCQQYGVDPAYLVAKWNAESNCGKRGIAAKTKSIGNIRYTPPKPHSVPYTNYDGFRSYATWSDAITDFCQVTRFYHEEKHLSTIEEITRVWTPSSENNTNRHQELVLGLMRRMYRHQIEKK